MTAYVFDGKKFAKDKEKLLSNKVRQLKSSGITPTVAAILVGNDTSSKIYIGLKKKAAERVGVELHLIKFTRTTQGKLVHLIKELNQDRQIHGMMVQLPLPGQLNNRATREKILNTIASEKDVDGLRSKASFLPATVKAILYSIKEAQKVKSLPKDMGGVAACVVGASGMVGKPLAGGLRKMGVEVVKTDVKTKNLKEETLKADLLISATGVPNLIESDVVRSGAVVIDVGAPKGDVDFPEVSKVASFITPVPGGIGPVTVISLMENVIEAAEKFDT